MEAISLNEFFKAKLTSCDLVLAHIPKFEQQHGIVEFGKIYRTKFLFANRYVALEHKKIDFVGGGSAWSETPNFAGEVGFLFLCHLNDRVYQDSWHGHIPIERHEDGLWCLLYQVKLWEFQDVPISTKNNLKPNTRRRDNEGLPFDTWIRFEALESYLMELIAELDQKPCEPFELVDYRPWLGALPETGQGGR